MVFFMVTRHERAFEKIEKYELIDYGITIIKSPAKIARLFLQLALYSGKIVSCTRVDLDLLA